MNETKHFIKERINREEVINEMGGAGIVVLTNVLDRGHKNGAERFELTNKGIIYVYNVRTNKLITVLFARVGQLYSRFGVKFNGLSKELQESIKKKCREYELKGYNNI